MPNRSSWKSNPSLSNRKSKYRNSKSRILKNSSRKRTSTFILKNSLPMLSVNWCRLSMWMPRISPAESGCSTSISSTMGWGTSLWMNWKQKKRRDLSHAKSAPLRELLQILFYGNSALGRTLPKATDNSDMYSRAFPVGNALFFFAGGVMSLLCLPCGKFSLAFLAVPAGKDGRVECPCQTVDDFIGVRGSVCGLFLFVQTHAPLIVSPWQSRARKSKFQFLSGARARKFSTLHLRLVAH